MTELQTGEIEEWSSPGADVLAALSSCLDTWQHSDSWDRFLDALASVQTAAMQAGHLALHEVCVNMHERMVQLSHTRERPDDEQCAVLAAWPSFALAWVESPGEPRQTELLVEFLQHPIWPQPLADEEADALREMLVVETGAFGSESLLEATIEAMNAPHVDADDSSDDGIPGYDGLSGYAKLGTTPAGSGRIVPDVRASIKGGMDDYEVEQLSVVEVAEHDVGQPEHAEEEPEPETFSELPETAHEMIQLLIAESSQIAMVLADIMPLATSETADENERREALEHFAEQVERFNGAVELLGLEGLCLAGQHFHMNILILSAGGEALLAEAAELLVHMWTAVPEYLEHPEDKTTASALTSLLAHPSWPRPADPIWTTEVEALLASPVVDIDEADAEQRTVRASPEDVSLELPDDVDMELLDGLLQDLPGQTAEFSRTVETLVSGGAPDDVKVAQRIAHTIKGAANTVGVAGLANLTHHLEDILAAIGNHGGLPGRGLSEVLVRGADCLESMGEALLGQGTPPMDALYTLQSVLDWANSIDEQGVAAVADDAMPVAPGFEPDRPEVDLEAASSSAAPVTAIPMIRVPAPLVDDLLRLVGETIILTGQIQERLDMATRDVGQNIENHLSVLKDMLSDQSRLIRENQEAVLKTRMVAVQTIVPRLQRSVRQASRLTGKAVELHCIGADTLVDSDLLGGFLDALMHVLRNAVDHGIEPQATRVEIGKDVTGKIQLEIQREGNYIVIRCEDDGGGLDLEAIREAAQARDLVADDEHLSDEKLIHLVLRPNFSTRTEVTQLSGRGIGLDAVNTQVVSLGGSLRVQSNPGKGCQIVMRLPLTLV